MPTIPNLGIPNLYIGYRDYQYLCYNHIIQKYKQTAIYSDGLSMFLLSMAPNDNDPSLLNVIFTMRPIFVKICT